MSIQQSHTYQMTEGVSLQVNGEPQLVRIPPDELLVDTLRVRLGLTGTKLGCGTGDCGTCTVLLDGEPVCACLIFTHQCDGQSVETVERTAETFEGAAVSGAMAALGGIQCGICTPGIIVSACALIRGTPGPVSKSQVREALAGNLCRCTGYEPIVAAVCAASTSSPRDVELEK